MACVKTHVADVRVHTWLTMTADRHGVRDRAAEQFHTRRILDGIITAVNKARLAGCIATAASV